MAARAGQSGPASPAELQAAKALLCRRQLLAGLATPFDAAVAAGYLHGLAGEQAAQKLGSERSVAAGDVVEALADAFRLLQ